MPRVMFAALAAVGCAKTAPVQVSMLNTADSPIDVELRYLELEHADDGWVRVNLSVSDGQMEQLSNGQAITVATPEVPKGEYRAARLAYTTVGMDQVDLKQANPNMERAGGAQDDKAVTRPQPRNDEVVSRGVFCLKKDESVRFSVVQRDTSLDLQVSGPSC